MASKFPTPEQVDAMLQEIFLKTAKRENLNIQDLENQRHALDSIRNRPEAYTRAVQRVVNQVNAIRRAEYEGKI